ncbi:OmpA family protein [Actinomadura sp. LD22]|uniref:OmpA family protein n=1 Tax=Actinomadura physcomitrii TaxID=2650748 RepID=A0A6I4M9Y8_9ACTN|nr:OmpA family protein [Actinomadura physcomitrii]MWA00611.1 OmpA family protein [Actinomadura physcomitrii]
MRRTIALAAAVLPAAAVLLSASGQAGAAAPTPDIPGSIKTIDAAGGIRSIDLTRAVVPLETEDVNGSQVTVHISADVLFDFGKAALTDAARRRIADLVPRLRDARGTVQVSGHTDAVGSPPYNLDLSRRRAEAVKAELAKALGGTALRIDAKGYGETRPIAPNSVGGKDDPSGRAKNRRVDISYEKA